MTYKTMHWVTFFKVSPIIGKGKYDTYLSNGILLQPDHIRFRSRHHLSIRENIGCP
jgi:hypothetical protein